MFFGYAAAEFERERLDRAFRSYVADSLHFMPQGQYVAARFGELVEPRPEIDAEAIVENVLARLGGD